MAPTEPRQMSAFERMRLKNMAANKAVLKGLETTAATISPVPKKALPKHSAPRSGVKKTEAAAQVVPRATRSSARLAGASADPEALKRKREVEEESRAQTMRMKKMRVNGDLSLGDIKVEGRYENSLDSLRSITRTQPGMRTFTEDDIKETTDEGLKELRTRMNGLEQYDQWLPKDIKITPERVYALAFHPTEEKPIIFAGDKEGTLGVFDASQKAPEVDDDDDDDDDENAKIPPPTVSAFKTHSRTITSLLFSPSDENLIYSSSYDSSIRKLDIDHGKSVQVWAPTDPSEDLPISHIDMSAQDPYLMFFSTLAGGFGRVDLRSPDHADMWPLSEQKIGGFSVHPLQPHLVATASLDRTLKIWDVRKFSGLGDSALPSLLGRHDSRLSVSHASWSASGHLATSSYDNTVKIYDFSDASTWTPGQEITEDKMEPAVVVPHNNQTGRWVSILKPQWQSRPKDGIQRFTIGNMNRFVDVYAADGQQLAQLDGDGISAVPAVAHFHPSMDWVAGGTASAKLCLWM